MSGGIKVMPPSPGLDGPSFFTHGQVALESIPDKGVDAPLVSYSIVPFPGKGNGFQVHEFVKCGQVIIREKAKVIGPKQCSPLVCVECCSTFTDNPNDDSLTHCSSCCLPLCNSCFEADQRPNHQPECEIFKTAGFKVLTSTNELITSKSEATKIFSLLTPLRFLLVAENDPSVMTMADNLEERANTMIFCYNQVYVVKFLHEKLFLNSRFTSEQIQRVTGILDTNCYELGWKGTRARAIFRTIARINHDCVPNARRFFDSKYRMVVVASRDIYPGEEVTLSYTPPLTSTPVRQIILQQTKFFQCHCLRCLSPSELGANLSGLKCNSCNVGPVLPVNPMDQNSEYSCINCDNIVEAARCRMIIETAMRFAGQECDAGGNKAQHILELIKNLERFVFPSHQLIANLKLSLTDEVTSQNDASDSNVENDATDSNFQNDVLEKAFSACQDLLVISQLIAPGQSRLRGILSKRYYQIVEMLETSGTPVHRLVGCKPLSPAEIESMFYQDISSKNLD